MMTGHSFHSVPRPSPFPALLLPLFLLLSPPGTGTAAEMSPAAISSPSSPAKIGPIGDKEWKKIEIRQRFDTLSSQVKAEKQLQKTTPNALPPTAAEQRQRFDELQALQKQLHAQVAVQVEETQARTQQDLIKSVIEHKDTIAKVSGQAGTFIGKKMKDIDGQISKLVKDESVEPSDSRLKALQTARNQLGQKKSQLENLQKLIGGVDKTMEGLDAASKLRDGDILGGGKDTLKFVQGFIPDKSGSIKAEKELFNILVETRGGTPEMKDALSREMQDTFGRISDMSGTQKVFDGLGEGVKTLESIENFKSNYLDPAKKVWDAVEKNRNLREGGASPETANLVSGMDAMGEALDKIADELPPGAKDLVKFYGEACQLPGKVYEKVDGAIDARGGGGAENWRSGGELRNTPGAKDYDGQLDKDGYLSQGGLHVYRDADDPGKIFVAPSLDEPLRQISPEEYRKLSEFARDYSIAKGEKLSNADMKKFLNSPDGNFSQDTYWGLSSTEIDPAKIAAEAQKKLDETIARGNVEAALGGDGVTDEAVKDWLAFQRDMKQGSDLFEITTDHPAPLTLSDMRELFREYQERKGGEEPPNMKDFVEEIFAGTPGSVHWGEEEEQRTGVEASAEATVDGDGDGSSPTDTDTADADTDAGAGTDDDLDADAGEGQVVPTATRGDEGGDYQDLWEDTADPESDPDTRPAAEGEEWSDLRDAEEIEGGDGQQDLADPPRDASPPGSDYSALGDFSEDIRDRTTSETRSVQSVQESKLDDRQVAAEAGHDRRMDDIASTGQTTTYYGDKYEETKQTVLQEQQGARESSVAILDATVDGVTTGFSDGIDVAVTRVTIEALGATGIHTDGSGTAGSSGAATVDGEGGSSGTKEPSPFQGTLAGGWSGSCDLDDEAQPVGGSFTMKISSGGGVSGSYSGDDSGGISGSVSASGDFRSARGSAGDSVWTGSISKDGKGGLGGSGSWSNLFCSGGWSGGGTAVE